MTARSSAEISMRRIPRVSRSAVTMPAYRPPRNRGRTCSTGHHRRPPAWHPFAAARGARRSRVPVRRTPANPSESLATPARSVPRMRVTSSVTSSQRSPSAGSGSTMASSRSAIANSRGVTELRTTSSIRRCSVRLAFCRRSLDRSRAAVTCASSATFPSSAASGGTEEATPDCVHNSTRTVRSLARNGRPGAGATRTVLA